ncbi:hypothetical protein AMJ57_00145 [Parcubacteria bacterium SG8_24]|nr:MAG: hypothetical protein AMJ57_00145 [Parcubacteria bacterium SG8_24]
MNHLQAFAFTLDDVGLALTVIENWENHQGDDGCHAGFYGTRHDGVYRGTLPMLSDREVEDVFGVEDEMIAHLDACRAIARGEYDDEGDDELGLYDDDGYDDFFVTEEGVTVPCDWIDGDDYDGEAVYDEMEWRDKLYAYCDDAPAGQSGVDGSTDTPGAQALENAPSRVGSRRLAVITDTDALMLRRTEADQSWKRMTRQVCQFLRHRRHTPHFD